MKDEIKEILNKLQSVANRETASRNLLMEMENKDYQLLLDYITNLQEENEKIKQERQNIDNRNRNQKIANRKLQEEIESVRKNNRTRKSKCKRQTKKKNMYKKRCELATEYINKLKNLKIKYVMLEEQELYASEKDFVNDLLNILQGKSDE